MRRHAARLALALAFSAFATGGLRAEQALSTNALRVLFPGTFQGTAYGIVGIQLVARRNGTLAGTIMGKKDRGRWMISRGQLCISLIDMTDGEFKCSYVRRNGQWLVANHGGPIYLRKH